MVCVDLLIKKEKQEHNFLLPLFFTTKGITRRLFIVLQPLFSILSHSY